MQIVSGGCRGAGLHRGGAPGWKFFLRFKMTGFALFERFFQSNIQSATSHNVPKMRQTPNGQQIWNTCSQVVNYESDKLQIWNEYLWFFSRKLGCHDIWWYMVLFPLIWGCSSVKLYQKRQNFNTPAKIAGILSWKCVDQGIRWWTAVQWTLESANFICNQIAYTMAHQKAHKFQHFAWILSRD